ncbi:phenylacetate-CoA oxygenase subunit PaaI [Kineobactrum sediminis]|uniref:Phenylacetate-CoA oxygenase subunit PaaI n=1 Tax=Kineobactrum sediminis TaxID=1905677 RepID=A0A2N5Y1V2_9GAMM|nr:1,2-phenylacetyl-CoA epoxidase subunit PaaC [Kineobactrum sediminis]PLW82374.1 phenylacetate-CoA oxygenase subunit PaaI [Kineobactrum sediminis]
MSAMTTQEATRQYAIRLGDDALILGHRLSEWCSNAPFLEEDLALTNVALDFIGRARMFYSYAAELSGDGRSEDSFAYQRDCREFTNLLMHELPRGDFAFTMARQYLIDEYSLAFMEQMLSSTDPTLAAIAAKAVKESRYHLRRSRDWVLRLGDGTEESHQRMQTAINELWGYNAELFEMDTLEADLAGQGIAVDTTALRQPWSAAVQATLAEATLAVPETDWSVRGGRQGLHTESLGHLLSELQFIQRAYPGLEW